MEKPKTVKLRVWIAAGWGADGTPHACASGDTDASEHDMRDANAWMESVPGDHALRESYVDLEVPLPEQHEPERVEGEVKDA